MTISGWVQPASSTPSEHNGYFGIRANNSGDHSFYVLQLETTDDLEFRFRNSVGDAWDVNASAAVSGGTWVYVTLTYDGDTLISYVDGQFVNQDTSATGSFTATNVPLRIGTEGSTSREMKGVVDEVRVSNSARAPQWTETEYNNQSSPSTFHVIGAETATQF